MSVEQRADAVEAQLEHCEDVGDDVAIHALHEAIAAAGHVRLKSIRNQSRAKRAKIAAKARPYPPAAIMTALRCFHLRRRCELLSTFLDELGVQHDEDGSILEDSEEPASVEQLLRAMRRILRKFPNEHCELYWDVLIANGGNRWRELPNARAALLTSEVEAAAPTPVEKPEIDRTPRLPERVGFTQLDRVVIDAILGAVAGTEGALSIEDVRKMVSELTALNDKRFISYHHRGFFDAVETSDRLVDANFPEANANRRCWYLVGAVAGYARRAQFDRILELVDKYGAEFDALGRADHPGASYAIPSVFEALRRGGRVLEATALIRPPAVGICWSAICEPLLAEVVRFLRVQEVDQAQPLLELLGQGMSVARELDADQVDDQFVGLVDRRRAHCLRLRRKWREADELLAQLATDGDGTLLADRGLIACKLRSLSDVVLPTDPSLRGEYAQTLEPGRSWFEKSVAASHRHGHGNYCMGVLHLAANEVEAARPHLRRAVAEMGRSSVYRELGVLGRAELYSAFAESHEMNAARAPAAISALASGLEDRPNEAPDLVKRTLENLAMVVPQRTREFLVEWQKVLGDGFLDIACQSQFLRDDEGLRDLVRRRAASTTRSADQRFFDHRALLAAAITTGDESAAVDELDSLEALSDELPELFLTVLDDPEAYGTLWELDDIAMAKARVLRGRGELPEAASCLRDVAFRVLRDGAQDGARQAAELLELIESFGVVPEQQLKAAISNALASGEQAVPAESPQTQVPTAKGVVLFVGGHETQARYDEEIRTRFAASHPDVEILLKHPGWESTWAKQLKRMEADVSRCDVMVIMRFVRTQLGRTLRKRCGDLGIRWYPCTGHGLESISRAVDAAVRGLV